MEPFNKVSIQEWNQLFNRFQTLLNRLEFRMNANLLQKSEIAIIDNEDFLKLFKISSKTAQKWRDNKVIAYSQIGNKFYYSVADVKQLLNNHYRPVCDN